MSLWYTGTTNLLRFCSCNADTYTYHGPLFSYRQPSVLHYYSQLLSQLISFLCWVQNSCLEFSTLESCLLFDTTNALQVHFAIRFSQLAEIVRFLKYMVLFPCRKYLQAPQNYFFTPIDTQYAYYFSVIKVQLFSTSFRTVCTLLKSRRMRYA